MKDRKDTERDYLAALAHDLRAPLAAINGFANAMLDGTAPTEKHADYVRFIASESKRMADMVEGLFQLSVLESRDTVREPFSLAELARIALLGVSDRLENKEIEPDICIEEVVAVGDRASTERAVHNLMDNAAKFVPHGGRLWLKVYGCDGKAFFELGNSGDAIPKDKLAVIFDKYVGGNRGGGAGLGLYTVKTALNKQGTDITASSDGNGTVFAFCLPSE